MEKAENRMEKKEKQKLVMKFWRETNIVSETQSSHSRQKWGWCGGGARTSLCTVENKRKENQYMARCHIQNVLETTLKWLFESASLERSTTCCIMLSKTSLCVAINFQSGATHVGSLSLPQPTLCWPWSAYQAQMCVNNAYWPRCFFPLFNQILYEFSIDRFLSRLHNRNMIVLLNKIYVNASNIRKNMLN